VATLSANIGGTRDFLNSYRYDPMARLTRIADHLVYSAFGQLTGQSATDPTAQPRFFFDGAYQDPQTGLSEMDLRWYDAVDGVFASQDPIGFNGGDTNLSRFVHNSPTNLTDPSGLDDGGPRR